MTSGLIEILVEDSVVQDKVGLNVAGDKYKVFPFVCPQGESGPFITVSKQSNSRQTLDKTYANQVDYPLYNVISWSKVYRTAELLNQAVRAALDNKGFVTEAGTTFARIWMFDERDGFDKDADMYACIGVYATEEKRPVVIT